MNEAQQSRNLINAIREYLGMSKLYKDEPTKNNKPKSKAVIYFNKSWEGVQSDGNRQVRNIEVD